MRHRGPRALERRPLLSSPPSAPAPPSASEPTRERPSALRVMAALATFREPSWDAWRAAIATLDGVPLTDAQAGIYRACTGRSTLPSGPFSEAYFIVGRRGGKSRIAALKAIEAACFRTYALAPGERAVVMIIAADRRQARVVFSYIRAFFDRLQPLRDLVERQTSDALHLKTGISIEIHTASFRAVRGPTVVGLIADELAFWRDETSANPDAEILAAIRPSMATVPGAQMVCISSPYARRGVLWDMFRRYFGSDDPRVLVWQADTRAMNPTVDQRVIDEAYARDDSAASAEYGAQFRVDIETFISQEMLTAAIIPGRLVLPPMAGTRYVAFVDPSGGSNDSMTLAIAHAERHRAGLDCLVERRPPFSPDDVTKEFSATLATYSIKTIVGDRYGGEWPRERFRQYGIGYDIAERTKSEIYLDALVGLNSGTIELLDVPRLRTQLGALERRTARGGRDAVDHAPNAHDDVANAACGALTLLGSAPPRLQIFAVDLSRVPRVNAPAPIRNSKGSA